MRITAFICILVILLSCTDSPEDKLLSLKESWVKADTTLISKERLEIRYEKALEYIQTHRPYWSYPIDDSCTSLQTDTLRQEIISYKIAPVSIIQSNSDENIFFNLIDIWACDIYEQPFYSLQVRTSPNSTQPSDESKLISKYSSITTDEITSWRKNHFVKLNETATSLLSSLPSDEESEHTALFEVPTGKSIRVHLPASYYNLKTGWDSLKHTPNQILIDTYAADVAIIFYDNNDEIEKVWWISWQT